MLRAARATLRSMSSHLSSIQQLLRPAPSICHDIRMWILDHSESGAYHVVAPSTVIERNPPNTLAGPPHNSFQSLLRVAAPERALVRLKNALVVGTNELVVLPDEQFVGELVAVTPAGQRRMLAIESGYSTRLPRRRKVLRGPHYPLSVIGWRNYYHWNHDVIMRLYQMIEQLPSDARFIVPQGLKPYHLDPLELVGIHHAQLVPISDQEVYEVEDLYIAKPIHKTQLDVPAPARWFRDKYHAVTRGAATTELPSRIYVRRAPHDTHYRTVNDTEVEACLRRYGFEPHYPGDLTVRQQATLFSQARCIVGTGTGMFNMVFAPPGATIVQFQEPTLIVHALWTLSESLGHDYWYVLGGTVPTTSGRLPDIHVPLDLLNDTLKHVLR